MSDGRVLVIDDDPTFCAVVTAYLGTVGIHVDVAATGDAGIAALRAHDHDVVLLDLGLPEGDGGLDVLKSLRELDAGLPVIILTADTSVASIVTAMRDGAWDYLSKPADRTKLSTIVRNAIERRRLLQRVKSLSQTDSTRFYGIIGSTAVMRRLFSQIERVARSDVTVAINGESGSGKELVARALHDSGPRKNGPFVAVNCAAIPESLQESEFFGHEKGAFTGAATRRIGRLEQADGGTLFLDEVAELSLTLQAKLLRALQERRFTRIGGNGETTTNFRLVTATHKDLAKEVAEGRFREDLYYRLAVFDLVLPPLRERPEDIPLLANHFLRQQPGPDGTIFRLDAVVLDVMMAHPWKGNVRELQNTIYHSLVLANDGVIRIDDLPPRVREGARATPVWPAIAASMASAPPAAAPPPNPTPPTLDVPAPAPIAGTNEGEGEGEGDDDEGDRANAADDADDDAGDDTASTLLAEDGDSLDDGLPEAVTLAATHDADALPVMTLEALERRAIEEAIQRHSGNLSAVAKELGLGRTTLYRKLQSYRPAP